MAKLTKEERQRNQRRRSRQLVGVLMSVLVVIGCAAVVRSTVSFVATLFDDTAEKEEYATRLAGLVLFDPLPFEGVENINDTTLREAAIWGAVYRIMATETGLDVYDRDPTIDQVMLPSIDVDAYLATIFGPDFQMTHKTFEMEGMTITYDETLQCYYIPVTGMVGDYTAEVVALRKESGRLYVTVGYISLETNTTILTSTTDSQIVKYMDYVFERIDGVWYLVALEESDMVAQVSATQAPVATSVPALEDFEAVILEDLIGSTDADADAQVSEGEDADSETASDEIEDTQDDTAEEDTAA